MAYRYFTGDRFDREAFAADLKPLLRSMLELAHLDLRFETQNWDEPGAEGGGEIQGISVNFEGRDLELLLEHNGELLLALEHLMMRSLRLDPRAHERVRFDAGDFRATRLAELKLSAQVAAQRVRELHQPFRMSPMSARERRVVHLALTNEKGVRTASEGEGERRRVVIYPTEKPERR